MELLNIFEASFEDRSFDESSIDDRFFLENAKEIVEEAAERERRSAN